MRHTKDTDFGYWIACPHGIGFHGLPGYQRNMGRLALLMIRICLQAGSLFAFLLLGSCVSDTFAVEDFNVGMARDELIQLFGEPDAVRRVPLVDVENLDPAVIRDFLEQPLTEIWQYKGQGPIYDSNGFEKYGTVTISAVISSETGKVVGVGYSEKEN